MKWTPEEERLSTCARLHAEHPGNTAAWAELRKAALRLAAALGTPGRKRKPAMSEAEIQRVRRERDARVEDKKRRRREWEAAQRNGER